jgi:hypothetical protein
MSVVSAVTIALSAAAIAISLVSVLIIRPVRPRRRKPEQAGR